MTTVDFPRFRAVADHAMLVEFADTISDAAHAQVIRLDGVLTATPPVGFREAVPAYVNLLVTFDPMLTDHDQISGALRLLLKGDGLPRKTSVAQEVLVCYDTDFAQDLPEISHRTGLSPEAVIAAHLGGDYRVFMYGFAPGYAYLAGVAKPLHLPRKPSAIRDIAAGSVIIAGQQCLVTTLTMPTGWWIIGRSPTRILRNDPDRPFLFDVGDSVQFRRITRAEFDAANETP